MQIIAWVEITAQGYKKVPNLEASFGQKSLHYLFKMHSLWENQTNRVRRRGHLSQDNTYIKRVVSPCYRCKHTCFRIKTLFWGSGLAYFENVQIDYIMLLTSKLFCQENQWYLKNELQFVTNIYKCMFFFVVEMLHVYISSCTCVIDVI